MPQAEERFWDVSVFYHIPYPMKTKAQTQPEPRPTTPGLALWHTPPHLWGKLKPLARQMRHEPTDAENVLWQHLRRRQLLGFHFRRQHPIERFVVDFYCPKAQLAVEVDGPVHRYSQQEDAIRLEFLESQGINVLRFSNTEVEHTLDSILRRITQALPLSAVRRGDQRERSQREV